MNNAKADLKSHLNKLILDGMVCLSGAVFVDYQSKSSGNTITSNTTVEEYVSKLSDEYAAGMLNMMLATERGDYVSLDDADAVLNEWLDQGGRPTNRDIVKHASINIGLLQHLVTFVLLSERFPVKA